MNIYPTENAVALAGAMLAKPSGAPIDPESIEIRIKGPGKFGPTTVCSALVIGGTVTSTTTVGPAIGGPIKRIGMGSFTFQTRVFGSKDVGDWTYKWVGSGAVTASNQDNQFEIARSDFYDL